jgi:DNA replication and repair protein RecF
LLRSLAIRNLRGYETLDLALEPGPQLVFGPNAAGKTTLLEAVVLLALGRSHRTSNDAELIRWGCDYSRVEGLVETAGGSAGVALDVTLQTGSGRKRIQVNGVPRRPAALAEHLRTVLFAPEEMLLVIGSPALRRAALDGLAAPHDRTYSASLATYGRALQQRNSLLRAIREGEAERDQLRYWDEPLLSAGAAIVSARLRVLDLFSAPLEAAHGEIAPDEGKLALSYVTNAPCRPGESPRDALARRLAETADKEVWNGTTLVGPHRDDLVFALDGRDLATFASRGQQRTAILAFKLAELDLLTALDGKPPLLLLDDVFSELDPDRRSHLVRRIAALPQAFVTTTTLEDIDPALRRQARSWRVTAGEGGARIEGAKS